VAEVLAEVVAAFERSTTRTSTDMLSLKAIINRSNMSFLKLTALALYGLSLGSFSLAFATTLITSMAATVEGSPADSHALRWLDSTLMTDGSRSRSATAAVDGDGFETGHASTRVTQLLAMMSARKLLHASLLAIRDRICARSASIGGDL